MAKLISIYWRDIPSQVIVKKGRKSAKIQLSERFQVAIDKAAMRAGGRGVRSIWMTGAEIIPNVETTWKRRRVRLLRDTKPNILMNDFLCWQRPRE